MDSQTILTTDNTSNDNILKDSGENDQPTFEQPQQHSTVEPTKEMQAQRELIDEALSVSEKLKEAVAPSIKNDKGHVEKKRQQIKNIENPFKNLNYKATQLIFWENPPQSGALLVVGLSILIFTAYYSLFNTFCALAVILMGANWVYVMGRKQLQSLINQKPINPHEHLLNTPWYIEREDLEKHLNSIINTANFLLVEAQRILLVDDPMRTIRHVIMFYILWTLGTWISLRTLFGIGLVLSFSAPIAYQKNKALVDEKLQQSNKLFQSYYEHGLDVAKQHTGGAYEKAKSFAVTKGLVKEE